VRLPEQKIIYIFYSYKAIVLNWSTDVCAHIHVHTPMWIKYKHAHPTCMMIGLRETALVNLNFDEVEPCHQQAHYLTLNRIISYKWVHPCRVKHLGIKLSFLFLFLSYQLSGQKKLLQGNQPCLSIEQKYFLSWIYRSAADWNVIN